MAQETVNYERWKYIGGSDIPVIMGISPFKTRWQLLREKAQLETDPFIGSIYTEYGNTMEPKIRDYLNQSLGFDFQEGLTYVGDNVRIHTDGEDILKDTILEVKTTSHIYESVEEYKLYLVQLLYYMDQKGMENGLLAVYERPEDLSTELDWHRLMTYPIEKKNYAALLEEIHEEVDLFRSDLMKLKQNPFMTEEDLLPDDAVLLAKRLIALKEAEDSFKTIKAEKELIEAKLGSIFDEEKRKTAEISGYKVTWTPPKEATLQRTEKVNMEKVEASPYAQWFKENCIEVEEKMGGAKKGTIRLTKKKGE